MNASKLSPTEQLAIDAVRAVYAGDINSLQRQTTPDATFWLTGTTPLSGMFLGRGRIIADLFPRLALVFPGGVEIDVRETFSDGREVCLELGLSARTRDGNTYRNSYCYVVGIRDGRGAFLRGYADMVRTAGCVFEVADPHALLAKECV